MINPNSFLFLAVRNLTWVDRSRWDYNWYWSPNRKEEEGKACLWEGLDWKWV